MTDESRQKNAKTSKSPREIEVLPLAAAIQRLRRGDNEVLIFVPCLDEIAAEKKLREGSYTYRAKPISAVAGVYRGQWGLICYRTTPPGLQKTAKRVLFADS